MTILDPKKVQEALQRHKKYLEKPRKPLSLDLLESQLQAQVAKLHAIASNLDGSELESLKQELQALYELLVQLQIVQGEANNPELANAFVVRRCEQELLSIRELQRILREPLEALRIASKQKDLHRMYAYLGGMIGAVGEKVEW